MGNKTEQQRNQEFNEAYGYRDYQSQFLEMAKMLMHNYAHHLQEFYKEMNKARNLWEQIHESERKQISMQNIHKMLMDREKEEGNLTKGLSNKEIELQKVKYKIDELKIKEEETKKESEKIKTKLAEVKELVEEKKKIHEEKHDSPRRLTR